MRGVLRNGLTALVSVVIGALPLYAQTTLRNRDPTFDAARQIASDLQKATFHRGPFYLLSSFELSDIGYESQIFVPTEEEVAGVTVTLRAPQRFYFVPRKKTIFSLELTPTYSVVSNGRDNQSGYIVRGDAQFLLNHLYIDAYGGQSDTVGIATADVNRLVTMRERFAGVKTEVKYSTRTSALFNAEHRQALHPRTRLQPDPRVVDVTRLDREENTYRGSFLHKTFPLTSLVAAAEIGDYTAPNESRKNSRRTYVGAGASYDSGRTVIRAEAGPGKLVFKDRTQKSFSGILGHGDITRAMAKRWELNGSLSRDIAFSLFESNNYFVAERAALGVNYSATRRLTLQGTAQLGRDRYEVEEVIPFNGLALREDNISYVAVGWNYAMRYLRGGFDVGYYTRESNFPGNDDDGIRLLVRLSFTP